MVKKGFETKILFLFSVNFAAEVDVILFNMTGFQKLKSIIRVCGELCRSL